MSFDLAIRLTEGLLGFAVAQASLEHLVRDQSGRLVFALRLTAAILLMAGLMVGPALVVLCASSLVLLHRFNGPYNGGSDKMTVLVVCCLSVAHFAPSPLWAEIAMGYLAVQLVLSYFISGRVKLVNPMWRSGQTLRDVFAFSAYPVSRSLRGWAAKPAMMWAMSWAVIAFEVLFPLSLFTPHTLYAALFIGAAFHLANALLFGLNRFFWVWIAAYPSLIWMQDRLLA
jgi:hypothetical protein